jgi:hypothetical protein
MPLNQIMPFNQVSSPKNASWDLPCTYIHQFIVHLKSSDAAIGILTLMDGAAGVYLPNPIAGNEFDTDSFLSDLKANEPNSFVEIESNLGEYGESFDTARILHQITMTIPADPEKTLGSMHDEGYLPISGMYVSYTSLK